MTHTPGPWIVRDCSDACAEKFSVERVTNGLRSVICRINDVEVCPEHGGTGSDANAALIAAAPELLSCLKQSLENAEMRQASGFECGPVIEREIERMQAAIAKAEGRS